MWKGPTDMIYRVNLDSMQFNRGQHALSYQCVREFLGTRDTTVLLQISTEITIVHRATEQSSPLGFPDVVAVVAIGLVFLHLSVLQ